MGMLMVQLTSKYIEVCIRFDKNVANGVEKTFDFACSIPVNEENKFVRLVTYWRKDSLFDIDTTQSKLQIMQSKMSWDDGIAPNLKVVKDQPVKPSFSNGFYSNYLEQHMHDEIFPDYDGDSKTFYDLQQNGKCSLTSNEWDIFDELDTYKTNVPLTDDSKQALLFDVWREQHSSHLFDKLFETVCLTKVQTIIAMLKLHPSNKPIIIALSNEKMYDNYFSPRSITETQCDSKALAHIFDENGSIKRIDSKGNIHNITISNFNQDIVNTDYYHKFMQVSSKLYAGTMMIFTRRQKANNIYIAYNGYIRLLSLQLNNEDLHYFLPQFIPFSKGLYINVETFSTCDSGTIIDYKYLKDEKSIIYKIRCDTNVVYKLNYYQLLNRTDIKIYFESKRLSLVNKDFARNNNIKLWKSLPPKQNPSNTEHPFHSIFLAIIESAKQYIASIRIQSNEQHSIINHQLQDSGIILLFYHTMIKHKNEKVENYKKENDTTYQEADYNHKSDHSALSKLINYLQREKYINNVKENGNGTELTYDYFCKQFSSILENPMNKVLVFNVIEHETEEMIESKHDEDASDDYTSDADEEFLKYTADDDGTLKAVENNKDIQVKSTFVCEIKYEFEMISGFINNTTLLVEDILPLISKSERSQENNKLLTRFYEFDIYNQYDLNNKVLINKLRNKLIKEKQIKTYQKFTAFMEQFESLHLNQSLLTQYAVQRVEVTRNAKCLQQIIGQYNTENDITENKILVIAYNPLQTVIIDSNIVQPVSAAVDLYVGAYEEHFYPKPLLTKIYAEWMRIFDCSNYEKDNFEYDDKERHKTVIDALSTLLKLNWMYDIILVPSAINLNHSFLSDECEVVAAHQEAIQDCMCPVLFLYKGNLYQFDTVKYKERYEAKYQDNNIQVDAIMVVLRQLYDNIQQNDNNSIPSLKWLTIGCDECYLQEMNGNITRVEARNDFAKELQNNMFMNYIDCAIPYNVNIINEDKKCAICRDLKIKPSTIGNNECKHTFCKKCIQQWAEMRQSKIDESYMYNNDNESDEENNSHPKCPLCQRKIIQICIDEKTESEIKQNIPITIYQQILDENESTYLRLHAIDTYNHGIQQMALYESAVVRNEPLPLQELYQNNPQMEIQDSGYC